MPYLPSSYSPGIVAVSLLIACFASYVALDLAKRVRTSDRRVALVWWLGGSVTMGTGIWCMHFIGMVAFSLPIPLGYSIGATVVSWAAAVLASAIGLHIASKGALTRARLAVGALTMGLGICAMHYIGMFALDMVPGIVWDMRLVLASVVIAVAASAASLWIFFWLRGVSEKQSRRYQPLAAVVMGFAICGMHYTGMAAANFPVGALCLSADGLADPQLGILIPISSAALLIMTLLTAVLDDRMRRSLKLANSRLQSANQALQKQAFQDSLTGLPNRLLFEDRLAHAVQRLAGAPELYASTRTPAKIAVLFIDLDGFKLVNDSLGHAAGDQVLKQIAQRLRLVVRESDTLARIGGDEFILLMEDIASLADAADLAQRLIEALSAPLQIHARQVSLSASVGLTLYPDHGDASRLVTNADAAMYAAKRIGGGTYAVFQAHMNEGALEQLNLHNELRHAIEHDPQQLQLYYQPKINGRQGHVEGVEALLRWNHPERGLLVPVLFIPLAERFGLINALGNWVIDEACRQMRAWQDQGLTIHVAINLSVHQLRTDQLA
ncbi:MAG TPA: MHYT domain-containing protein, partial [Castellaniella sp.]|nr:MHYT domain-containing protein [Castellaniella sp.]